MTCVVQKTENEDPKEAFVKRITDFMLKEFPISGRLLVVLACACLVLINAPMGVGQSATSARLTGTVTDPSGAVVPGVKVTAHNVETNFEVTVESDSSGDYAFNSLPVGHYKVTALGAGFSPLVTTGVELTVGQSATLNETLKPGAAQDTVTVTGGAELINTTSAELSQVVDQSTIKDLPLNGRDPGTLVFLSAGVTNELNSQASTLQATNSFPNESGASAGGQRQGSTWYLLDGVSNMDTYTLLSLPFPNPGCNPGISCHLKQLRRAQRICSFCGGQCGNQVRKQFIPRRGLRISTQRYI